VFKEDRDDFMKTSIASYREISAKKASQEEVEEILMEIQTFEHLAKAQEKDHK
jgi:hypothetical protein